VSGTEPTTSDPVGELPRLCRATLSKLPLPARPAVEPDGLGVGLVHLGIGAFHRAHQAVYTEGAMAAAGGDWGICGVTQRSGRVREQLAPQDGLYGVMVRSGEQSELRVLAAVREVLDGAADPAAVVARLASPAISVVTLTVTEKGYHHDPATGRLRWEDPEVAADVEGRPPRTPVGRLGAAIIERARGQAGPLTIVSCDNLSANGRTLAGLVTQYLERVGADEARAWVEANVSFPSTMVDRIVPATTDADRVAAAEQLGLRDEGLVVTEPFHQWVIEDCFAGPRPAWERAGALLAADVEPYERAKVRLLNASHSTMAYLGQLAGYEYVADVVRAGSPIMGVVEQLMAADAIPTLAAPPGLDLAAYCRDLLARFANPALAHRTAQIAMDGSHKLPPRLLSTIADRRAVGAEPRAALLTLAAWMRVVGDRRTDDDQPLIVDDPLADQLAEAVAGGDQAGDVVAGLLGRTDIFGSLGEDAWVRHTLAELLTELRRDGAEATCRHLIGQ
jgi:fructuronate reductase